jgi:hypothetical protein
MKVFFRNLSLNYKMTNKKSLVKHEAFEILNRVCVLLGFFFLNAHLTAHGTLVQYFIRDRRLFKKSPATILF